MKDCEYYDFDKLTQKIKDIYNDDGISVNLDRFVLYTLGEYRDNPVGAYIVSVINNDADISDQVLVSINDGDIISKNSNIVFADLYGSGKDEKGDKQYFPVKKRLFSDYEMYDKDRKIGVYDSITDKKPLSSKKSDNWDNPKAVSAYTNMYLVYDWYDRELDYQSYDGEGSEIKVYMQDDNGMKDIEIPTLQVFNYMYHEHLSDNIKNNYNSYTDEEKQELEKSFEEGKRDDKELDYIHTKGMVSRFVDKEDIISHNKTERLIETVYELINLNPSIELVSEPFINGENMVLHLNGKTDILKDYNKKERTI